MSGKILIYLDNSNIFLSTKVYSGKRKGFRSGISDESCRLYIDKIVEAVLDGRNKPSVQRAYGIMDEKVIAALRRVGFEVSQSTCSKFTFKEKEADTQLVADAVEDIITKSPTGADAGSHSGTVIIFSGDKDMLPLIKKARKYGWQVEVWCYQNSLSDSIKVEKERKVDGSIVQIYELEKLFDQCTDCSFISWKDTIPAERSFWIKFDKSLYWYKTSSKLTKEILQKSVATIGAKHFELPVATVFQEQEQISKKGESSSADDGNWRRQKTTTTAPATDAIFLAVIVTISERKRDKSCIYDFYKDVWSKRSEFLHDVTDAFDEVLGTSFETCRLAVVPYNEHKAPGGDALTNGTCDKKIDKLSLSKDSPAIKCGPKGAMCIYEINGKCKHESDSSQCYFAHSKSELICRSCGKKGSHPTGQCKFLKVK